MWTKEQLTLLKNPKIILVVTSSLSAAAGTAAGYAVAQRRLKAKYEAIAEQEIADAKEFYGRLYKKDNQTPQEILENLHGEEAVEAMKAYQGLGSPDEVSVLEEESDKKQEVQERVNSIFSKTAPVEDDWSYEAELRIREENPAQPYILSHDEFFEGEKDYEQATLTYFAGDDTLADEQGGIVPEETVGDDNLAQFGHGYKDKNIVYIRNEQLEMDFEIHQSFGRYAKEVLGFDDEETELKHSYSRPRKFRGHDE